MLVFGLIGILVEWVWPFEKIPGVKRNQVSIYSRPVPGLCFYFSEWRETSKLGQSQKNGGSIVLVETPDQFLRKS
jgi:hypothetical protein